MVHGPQEKGEYRFLVCVTICQCHFVQKTFNPRLDHHLFFIFTFGLDIDETDMHITYPQTLLDLFALDDTGLLELTYH